MRLKGTIIVVIFTLFIIVKACISLVKWVRKFIILVSIECMYKGVFGKSSLHFSSIAL